MRAQQKISAKSPFVRLRPSRRLVIFESTDIIRFFIVITIWTEKAFRASLAVRTNSSASSQLGREFALMAPRSGKGKEYSRSAT
jgi:hypothetical protein